jgi:hypothetical protein
LRFPQIAFVFILVALTALPISAQSPNGTINGLVIDHSNRVITGADILVINDATGVKYSSKTNNDGIYAVPNLPPGPYRLQVSKAGFKTLIKPDIVLNVQDALSINFTLPLGAVFEIVTVEAGASMVNTTDASVSTVVDQSYIKNMPLNGRSFQDLILLTPGVVTQSPQNVLYSKLGPAGEFSVNGQRLESNSYTVDGVSANVGVSAGSNFLGFAGPSGSVPASTALGTTQSLVSVDALQEFRVQSSTYSAEYGRNPGGQFSFETKSGTNQWHGSAYDYLRNGAVDAQDWFNDYFSSPQPPLRQNDFGGTVGGPFEIPELYNGKDRTFFFFSYEGLRLTAPQAATGNPVPDLCMRGLDVCPPGRLPAASALQPIVNAFPLPSATGFEDAADGVGQFIGGWSNPSSLDSTSVRFDHFVNDKLRLFFRFSDTGSQSNVRKVNTTAPPTVEAANVYSFRAYTAGATSSFSSRVTNDFRLNYTSNMTTNRQFISPFGGSSPASLRQLSGIGPDTGEYIYLFLGPYLCFLGELQTSGAQRQWNLVDTITLSSGRHQTKVGVDFRRLAPFAGRPSYIPAYFFFGESNVELNSGNIFPSASAPAYPLYKNLSAFAQDEWRASQRLSLSFGLRWDVNPAPGAAQGTKPYAIQGSGPSTWTLARRGVPLWPSTWLNFAPRLGVAYILHNASGRETVVHVGGGVFFDTGQQGGASAFSGPGFTASGGFPPMSFPGNPAALAPPIINPPAPPFPLVYGAVPPYLKLPYTLQWNARIEQALGRAQALTISFVGSHAARLLEIKDINTPSNPTSSRFYTIQNGLTSDYDAAQVQFRRRLSRGLTALASYTWSHCIDYGSQDYSLGYERGNCDFDVRNNLSAALSYDVPSVIHGGFVGTLMRHWGFDGRFTSRTGFPVTLQGNYLNQPDGSAYYGGVDLVAGQPIYLYGTNCDSVLQSLGDLAPGKHCPGGRVINPQAFADVSSGLGNAPRNFATGSELGRLTWLCVESSPSASG